jgi:hypothetical protein
MATQFGAGFLGLPPTVPFSSLLRASSDSF